MKYKRAQKAQYTAATKAASPTMIFNVTA